MRDLDGYENKHIRLSLNPDLEANQDKIFKSGEGMGKSGSFFFFSHDDNFLIKTMTIDDFRAFKKMFQFYFHHINVYRKSLIAPIYGVYSIKMDDKDPVFLILMGNTKKKCKNCHMKRIFDLKGSLVKREVFKHEDIKEFKNTAVLKDKNLLHMKK